MCFQTLEISETDAYLTKVIQHIKNFINCIYHVLLHVADLYLMNCGVMWPYVFCSYYIAKNSFVGGVNSINMLSMFFQLPGRAQKCNEP